MRLLIAILLMSFFLVSCKAGYVSIEKDKDFALEKLRSNKIVTIDPQISAYQINFSQKVKRKEVSIGKKRRLHKSIKKTGSINGLEIEILSDLNLSPNDTDYFNETLRLKDAIVNAMVLQKAIGEDDEKKKNFFQKLFNKQNIEKIRWEKSPIISSEFSYLAKKYNTPYFNIQGILHWRQPNFNFISWIFLPIGLLSHIQNGDRSLIYNILVDVEKSEIVFREFRITERKARMGVISPMLYESYYFMTNN